MSEAEQDTIELKARKWQYPDLARAIDAKRIYLMPIANRPFFPAQVQPLVIQAETWEETFNRIGNT